MTTTLKGSEKQIKWGKQVRAEKLPQIKETILRQDEYIAEAIEDEKKDDEAFYSFSKECFQKYLEILEGFTLAEDWIKMRNVSPNNAFALARHFDDLETWKKLKELQLACYR